MASAMKTSKSSKSSASPSKKKRQLATTMKKKSSLKRPNYQHMITEALGKLDSRKGSSRSKIFNHLKTTYGVESGRATNTHIRTALEALLETSIISMAKGTGYSNAYYKMTPKGKRQMNKRSSLTKGQSQRRRRSVSVSKHQSPSKAKPAGRSKSKSSGQMKSRRSTSRSPSKSKPSKANQRKTHDRKSAKTGKQSKRGEKKATLKKSK